MKTPPTAGQQRRKTRTSVYRSDLKSVRVADALLSLRDSITADGVTLEGVARDFAETLVMRDHQAKYRIKEKAGPMLAGLVLIVSDLEHIMAAWDAVQTDVRYGREPTPEDVAMLSSRMLAHAKHYGAQRLLSEPSEGAHQ